ncbi:MAG TPA: proton-conducting transporter membrane subunit [Candidatus Binatia bacterium]|nr:proton-conducting transporter membrane subunit [Candidatus Binatia bacterium]
MTVVGLLLVPLLGAAGLALNPGRAGRLVHGATAGLTLGLAGAVVAAVVRTGPVTALDGLLRVDALSAWLVALIGLVGALVAAEAPRQVPVPASGRFYPLLHLFVFTMLLAVTTDDVGLMWVAVEATTLASVFLVNHERSRASLEAAYKYVLICSVGVAIAFAGTILIYFADIHSLGRPAHALRWTALVRVGPELPVPVVQLAFVFLLVGYGTKAGLAPMHTWLPDAHSEAPAPVSALMSGVLLSVGLYAIVRFKVVADLAAGPAFTRRLLLALGLGSVAVAAAFVWSPRSYKRMLAYSSIEHAGIACLGLGFGGPWGLGGALLHVANHALAKSVLFLLSGRIRAAYGSPAIGAVSGLSAAMPLTGRSFLLAMLALLGLPPFGLFVSEFLIFGAGFRGGHAAVAAAGLGFLLVAFAGLLRATHRMLYGAPPAGGVPEPTGWAAAWPVAAALGLLVATGLAWPPGLAAALESVAGILSP